MCKIDFPKWVSLEPGPRAARGENYKLVLVTSLFKNDYIFNKWSSLLIMAWSLIATITFKILFLSFKKFSSIFFLLDKFLLAYILHISLYPPLKPVQTSLNQFASNGRLH